MPEAVLHLVDCLNPGGTERQLIEQCLRLDRHRWRPIVAAFHARGQLEPELHRAGIAVATFPLRTQLIHTNTAEQIVRLAGLCRRERVRLIHAHDFYANLVGSAVARLAGTRLITSRRDCAHWLSPAQRWSLGTAFRAADRLLVNGTVLGEMAVRELGVDAARVRVIHNGIDLDRFDAEARLPPDPPLPSSPPETATLVVLANMHFQEKGHTDLLLALPHLQRSWRLLLVGGGVEQPRLEAMARELGLEKRVLFLGPRQDAPRILARADLACSASWAEGMPNALLEAMAASRPVVATTVGGCPELLAEGGGELVPPHNPERLALAITNILSDPPRLRLLGNEARRSVEHRFTIQRAAKALDRLYCELLP